MAEKDIVVFVEEASALEIVRAVSSKLGLAARVKILKHQGADDLKKSMANKIMSDPFESSKFMVLCDADGKDCKALKRELMEKVPQNRRARTLVRIVCQELEAWYLAQPEALSRAGALAKPIPHSVRSKSADAITNPKRTFRRYAHEKGQIEHARRIGPELETDNARSQSFQQFITALQRLAKLK